MEAGALEFSILAPLGFVAIGAVLALVGEIWLARGRAHVSPWLVVICSLALALALFTAATTFAAGITAVFDPAHPMLRVDPYASFVFVLLAAVTLLSIWLSMSYLPALRIDFGEYYGLVMLSLVGMFVAVAAIDTIAFWIGLELMSLPLHALAGFDRRRLRSNESGLKLMLIGTFGSAILLYGIALLYGATGATSFFGVREGFEPDDALALSGLALVLTGMGIKIGAVPFHQWVPDVLEGAPTSVSAFVAGAVPIAGVAALVRFVVLALPGLDADLRVVVGTLAGLTMMVGSLLSIVQTNIKRLLAWSSVAQVGFALIAVAAGTPEALAALLFALCAQAATLLGAYGLIAALARAGREHERIEDYAGAARRRPGVAALLTLFALSLAAVPGTAGFMARFQLLRAAIDAELVLLVLVGAVSSLVTLYAQLRLPAAMYMRESGEDVPGEVDTFAGLALAACAVGVLWLGLLPDYGTTSALDAARVAAEGLGR